MFSVVLLINACQSSEELEFFKNSFFHPCKYFCSRVELAELPLRCHTVVIKWHCSFCSAYFDTQHCFTFLPLPSFIFPGVVYPAVSPPIVSAVRGFVFFCFFSHTIRMQIVLPPRINIYSVPRSVVINRMAAGEILLSLSLGVPSRLATLRSAGPVRETSRLHASCVSVRRRVLMNMCVCT